MDQKLKIDPKMNVNELITKQDLIDFEKRLYNKLNESFTQKKSPKYLRTKDISEMLGVSASTIQNLRINGILPYRKIGGTIIYERDEIEAALLSLPDNVKHKTSFHDL